MPQETGERLYRGSDRILGGVCSGLASRLRIDPLWIRIAFVLLALLQGIGVLLYIVMWVVMPEQPGAQAGGRSSFSSMMADMSKAWRDLQVQFGGTTTPSPAGTAGVPTSHPTRVNSLWQNPSVALGLILVVVGVLVLAGNMGLIHWNLIWPAALIALGVLLLVRSAAKRS